MKKDVYLGKGFVTTAVEQSELKSQMSNEITLKYLMRAMMSGIILAFMYTIYFSVIATFDSIPVGTVTLKPIGSFIAAMLFGFALIFIYFTKSELTTSNMMYTSVGRYFGAISWKQMFKILGFTFLGNILGGLFISFLLGQTTIFTSSMQELMSSTIQHKLEYYATSASGGYDAAKILDAFVRAIFCNFFINIAMLLCISGHVKSEIVKVLGIIFAVFIFVTLGLEHSVANSVLFLVGFFNGVEINGVEALLNIIVALIGNFIGGGLLIGAYYSFINDDRK
ncbi:MAG: formate/nitrite transporter family protein [Mycoplasmatales bacterium]